MGFLSAFARRATEHGVNLFVGTLGGLISTIALDAYKSWSKTQANPGPVAAVVAVLPSWLLPTLIFLLIISVAIFAPPMLASKAGSRKGEAPQESLAGRERDEINTLKRTIDAQRDEVYQVNAARDEMRAERDACSRELQEMTGQRDYVEAQWKAHLRDVDATTVPRNIANSLAEERNALREQVQALEATRDAQQSAPGPMLSGCVKRFEILDGGDLSDLEMKSFDLDMGRAPTVSEGLRTIFNRPPGAWYIAWFQVEALSAQSKATDWAYEVKGIGGEGYPCAFASRDWKPPKSWPALEYSSLEQIENMYLESNRVYDVFVHVVCEAAYSQIRFETFEARCRDSAGQEIVLRMAQ